MNWVSTAKTKLDQINATGFPGGRYPFRQQVQFLVLRSAQGLRDYEEAAHMNNRCRTRGIARSAVDLLICASAHRRGWAIFTTDQDFQNYASVLPLRLQSASTRD